MDNAKNRLGSLTENERKTFLDRINDLTEDPSYHYKFVCKRCGDYYLSGSKELVKIYKDIHRPKNKRSTRGYRCSMQDSDTKPSFIRTNPEQESMKIFKKLLNGE